MHTGNCAVLSRKRRRRRIYREQKSRTKLETKKVQILSLWPLSSNFNRQPYYTLCSSVIHATYLLLPLTELRIFIAVDIQFDFYFQSYWILIIRVEFLIYTYIYIWEIQLVFDRSRHFRLRSADRSSTSYFLFFLYSSSVTTCRTIKLMTTELWDRAPQMPGLNSNLCRFDESSARWRRQLRRRRRRLVE